jgi:ATPase subunit of ABC transporter with duplicated ATPase domains
MPFLTLTGLGYRTPDGQSLFDDLSLAFGRERTGLVGRNGAGKTTLFRLMLGEIAPSAGVVSRAGRIGLLRQMLQPPPGARVAELLGVGAEVDRLARIARGQAAAADLDQADWTLAPRLAEALVRVGLPDLDPRRPAESLSGGEATRVALAALLIGQPDLILLDEPTNNLDAAARELVGQLLAAWRGGAVVISHDRTLLRRMDRIVELSDLGARVYGGGYDLYAERRVAERQAAAQALDQAERAAAQAERDIQAARERQARRDSAGHRAAARGGAPKMALHAQAQRAQQSGGRGAHLADRQRAEARDGLAEARSGVERLKTLAFELPSSGLAAGRRVLALEAVSFAWPGAAPVLSEVSLDMVGPARVAITGPNGAGKTTLLRLIAGDLQPASGHVVRGGRFALLDQRTALLDETQTILANFRRLNPDDDDEACRGALARFLFRADAALRLVAGLSGGERLRAALACALGGRTPPQLLILDEPTNHLDLGSIAAVEAAVAGYDGAVLAVSHDPDFLTAIGVQRYVSL